MMTKDQRRGLRICVINFPWFGYINHEDHIFAYFIKSDIYSEFPGTKFLLVLCRHQIHFWLLFGYFNIFKGLIYKKTKIKSAHGTKPAQTISSLSGRLHHHLPQTESLLHRRIWGFPIATWIPDKQIILCWSIQTPTSCSS